MARPEITGRKALSNEVDSFSVSEFCQRNGGISVQLFYKLKPRGLMPRTFRLGTRVLISKEAAAAWRREREAAPQPGPSRQGRR